MNYREVERNSITALQIGYTTPIMCDIMKRPKLCKEHEEMMREIVGELAWRFNGTALGNILWIKYEKMKYKQRELWKGTSKRKGR